ncbi:hypothetical protein COO60DRAFT_1557605 [Scenedesmus sp. NREL 46B-D3]|nr:hypothetical protein COO60DRAFT_1557605 [Scenedesmus sp. NREL 46B-D3]
MFQPALVRSLERRMQRQYLPYGMRTYGCAGGICHISYVTAVVLYDCGIWVCLSNGSSGNCQLPCTVLVLSIQRGTRLLPIAILTIFKTALLLVQANCRRCQ